MIRQALIGCTISIICLVPPIIHFVTGPLGPFIGGWFAGSRHQALKLEALCIGVIMGCLMSFPVALVFLTNNLTGILDSWIDGAVLVPIGIFVLIYTTVMASMGAMLGGRIARRSNRRTKS